MDKDQRHRLATLESKVDILETELDYLNRILVKCGFPEGIQTLKETVEELISEGIQPGEHNPSSLEDYS